jgi:hypothetical protein
VVIIALGLLIIIKNVSSDTPHAAKKSTKKAKVSPKSAEKSPVKKNSRKKNEPEVLGTIFSPEGRRSSRANKGVKREE